MNGSIQKNNNLEAIINQLQSDDDAIRIKAIKQLSSLKKSEVKDAILPLIRCLHSSNPLVIIQALKTIGKFRVKQAIPAIFQILKRKHLIYKDSKGRIKILSEEDIAKSLKKMGRTAIPAILEEFKTYSPIRLPSNITIILADLLLKKEKTGSHGVTIYSLRKNAEKYIPYLLAFINSPENNDHARGDVAWLLGVINLESAIPNLVSLLMNCQTDAAQWGAVKALWNIGLKKDINEENLALIIEALEYATQLQSEDVRSTAMIALDRIRMRINMRTMDPNFPF
ncbi:MAG: hypothetical protein GF308_21375 [Candidatus Heimdallarchaeota archaeon]|nr:hypothetical protein [Candidatus Heimdallarchaeota archaeon]